MADALQPIPVARALNAGALVDMAGLLTFSTRGALQRACKAADVNKLRQTQKHRCFMPDQLAGWKGFKAQGAKNAQTAWASGHFPALAWRLNGQ